MRNPIFKFTFATLPIALFILLSAVAQAPDDPPRREGESGRADENPARTGEQDFDGPAEFRPRGTGSGRGGFGGLRQETKLVEKFDKDGDKRLNEPERKAAREFLKEERAAGRGPRGPGGPGGRTGPGGGDRDRFGGRDEDRTPPQPGPKLSPPDVKWFPDASLYDPYTLRTLFLVFENSDWEKELIDLHNTDVEVPATLMVDGQTYRDVGIHFRGMSSFRVAEGRKRSINLSLDFVHDDQQLSGYRTLNLLNSHEDPTYLRSLLYYQIARDYIPAPKANFVRVVINGESWGIYVNAQQFNSDFIRDWFGTTKGARWKVPGSPGGQGSLVYLGDDIGLYKRFYEIKSKDAENSWSDLAKLCKVLNQTPVDQLEVSLAPLLDIEGALKFLALENVLINNDGYWVRTSDYNIYQDESGRFHIIPHDANETFARPGGPGFGGRRGGPGGSGGQRAPEGAQGQGGPDAPPDIRVDGVKLDPLIFADDSRKPLISKLLAVPSLRSRYLRYVRNIAEKWLDWNTLGPLAQSYQDLIAADVKTDTRKLASTEDFQKGLTEDIHGGSFRGRGIIGLKNFADQRRAFLLQYSELKAVQP